ncbi:phosphotransferase [Mycolicibacillus parakoreensis]|uniref:Phosphotransferase n=2 Tax=Mycobacteriaceae TaxID=1762 RepID=A0ABY3U5K7_9MYCO|nr:phosphotransferase [Mycolicibacillus parakoreensis]MCV7315291.1 phosphotransferase [Mycolicibacillus parakoreensis]ULN53381.1 phosphotransferase [Mycolicibacillus parakoreensis]
MIPALDLLLGTQARPLVAAAVQELGGRLDALRVRAAHAHPDGAAIVQYAATVSTAEHGATAEVLVAVTGSAIPPGAAVVEGRHRGRTVAVGLWRWPHDPGLPGLAAATDPIRLEAVLTDAGLDPVGVLRSRVRGYRPLRRAVLEVTDGTHTWFVKVVPPAAVSALQRRHALAHPVVPAPAVLAATGDGVVVLAAVAGRPMRELFGPDRHAAGPPPPADLEALLDALPEDLLDLPRQYSHPDRFADYAAVLAATAGEHEPIAARLASLTEALHAGPAPGDAEPLVAVHGDFYEAQIFVDGGRITGLIDLDTTGPGHRVDDWATLLAHLSGLTLLAPYRSAARRYLASVWTRAQRRHRACTLRRHTAAALVGFATGPFRSQQRGWPQATVDRLDLAVSWLTDGDPQ